jgi:hypothetical protein
MQSVGRAQGGRHHRQLRLPEHQGTVLLGGREYSALRAGLTFVPTAVVFGLVGLTWRDWPAPWQRALTPAGFVITALAVAGVGLDLKGGDEGGALLYVAYAGVGAGLALAFSPTLTRALATVAPENAADASGLLATVTQLGRLIGAAGFGTLFLNRLESLGAFGAYTSARRCRRACSRWPGRPRRVPCPDWY